MTLASLFLTFPLEFKEGSEGGRVEAMTGAEYDDTKGLCGLRAVCSHSGWPIPNV